MATDFKAPGTFDPNAAPKENRPRIVKLQELGDTLSGTFLGYVTIPTRFGTWTPAEIALENGETVRLSVPVSLKKAMSGIERNSKVSILLADMTPTKTGNTMYAWKVLVG